MTAVGFEPTVSAGERPQTHASDSAATGTGRQNIQSESKSVRKKKEEKKAYFFVHTVVNMCTVFLWLLMSCSSVQSYGSLREKLLNRFQNCARSSL